MPIQKKIISKKLLSSTVTIDTKCIGDETVNKLTPDSPPLKLKYEVGLPKTYVRNYDIPQLPLSCPISPSQFPSPHHRRRSEINKENDQPSKKIPRFVLNSPPKKVVASVDNGVKNFINNILDDRPEVKTFVVSQIFHKKKSTWTQAEQTLFLEFYFKSPAFYKHLLKKQFNLPGKNNELNQHCPNGGSRAIYGLRLRWSFLWFLLVFCDSRDFQLSDQFSR